MPGSTDVWNSVTYPESAAPTQAGTPDSTLSDSPSETPAATTRRRRRPLLIAALATALVATGGTVAVAGAHKTVTLDVDGEVTTISTFAGSVGGVLAAHELELGPRDAVTPEPGTSLASGDEIVVRHARQVALLTDGEEAQVWTTALSADEALVALAARGQDVSLVASRSADGRASISLRLDTESPVDVVVDGATHTVDEGANAIDQVFGALDLTLHEQDRVSVRHTAGADSGAPVTIVVERVVGQVQTTVAEVPFETVTEQTDALYRGQSEVAQQGVVGEHTTVDHVVLVDGQEESRENVSDGVTREPVTHVVRQGTKERPAPRPAPAPAQASSAGESSASAPAAAAPSGDVWARLAQCESGGNPSIVSANGLYHGLYQFRVDTWRSVGGSGLPSQASPAEQTQRAQILQARSGWGQWPACSRKLGLR